LAKNYTKLAVYFKEDNMTQQPGKIKQGEKYTVQAGDTRKSIAIRAYDNSNKWKLIYNANEDDIKNFDRRRLPPGTVLEIPAEGGGGSGDHH
jgi:nucleoid-associated protein YgaU